MNSKSLNYVAGGLAIVIAARAAAEVLRYHLYEGHRSNRFSIDEKYIICNETIFNTASNQIAIAGVGFYFSPVLKDVCKSFAAKTFDNHWAATAIATVGALTISRGFIAPKINNFGIDLGEKLHPVSQQRHYNVAKTSTCVKGQGVKYAVLETASIFGYSTPVAQMLAGTIKSIYSGGSIMLAPFEGLSLSMYSRMGSTFNVLAKSLGGGLNATFAANVAKGVTIECATQYLSPTRKIGNRHNFIITYGSPLNILKDMSELTGVSARSR